MKALVALAALAIGSPLWAAHIQKEITFHEDGVWLAEQSASLRIDSEAAVRRYGTLSFLFDAGSQKLEILYARVRKPNGEVIETPPSEARDTAQPVDADRPVYSDDKEKQLPVRSLQPGDVLEYRIRTTQFRPEAQGQFWYSESLTDPDSSLTIRVPEHKYVHLKSDANPETHIENGLKVYRWAGVAVHAQLTTFHDWYELGVWYASMLLPAVQVTPSIQAKADEITLGAQTAEQKQRAVYAYVSTRFRYVALALGSGKYQPHTAGQVLANGYGDCKDKHTLFAALLKAEGITAWPALVGSEPISDLPTPENFEHVVSVIGDTWLDTTLEVAPYGLLAPGLRGSKALLVRGQSSSLIAIPVQPPFTAHQEIVADATLDTNGDIHAHMQLTLRGDDELPVRIAFHGAPQQNWVALVQNLLGNLGMSGTVKNVSMSSPEDLESPFHLAFDFDQSAPPGWANSKLILPMLPFLFSNTGTQPEKAAQIGISGEMVHQVTLHLPAQLSANLPDGFEIDTPFASYSAKYSQRENRLLAERRVRLKQTEVASADWPTYLAFVQQVKQSEAAEIQFWDARAVQAESLINAATTAISQGDIETAREQLSQASKLNPKQSGLAAAYAQLYASNHNYAAAISAQKTAVAADHESIVPRLTLAELLLRAGQSGEGVELLHQIASSSQDPAVLNNAAYLLAQTRTNLETAVHYAQTAVDLMEQHLAKVQLTSLTDADLRDVETLASLWDTLGYALSQSGDHSTARKYLAASWTLSRNKVAREHLGQSLPDYSRTFKLQASPGQGTADFFLLFEKDRPADAQFISGSDALKDLKSQLLAQCFPPVSPDAGPERIVRRAVVDCSSMSCTLTLLLPAAATK